MKIQSQRLELIAGDAELTRADLEDRMLFARLLHARVPRRWPPPLNDRASQKYLADYFAKNPDAIGWGVWYYVLREPERVLVGNGGFKGRPSSDGMIEVGYSILEEYQNIGIGTEALQALIGWAFSHHDVKRVVAESFPDLKPSLRILEKTGFKRAGPGSEKGSLLFELTRDRSL